MQSPQRNFAVFTVEIVLNPCRFFGVSPAIRPTLSFVSDGQPIANTICTHQVCALVLYLVLTYFRWKDSRYENDLKREKRWWECKLLRSCSVAGTGSQDFFVVLSCNGCVWYFFCVHCLRTLHTYLYLYNDGFHLKLVVCYSILPTNVHFMIINQFNCGYPFVLQTCVVIVNNRSDFCSIFCIIIVCTRSFLLSFISVHLQIFLRDTQYNINKRRWPHVYNKAAHTRRISLSSTPPPPFAPKPKPHHHTGGSLLIISLSLSPSLSFLFLSVSHIIYSKVSWRGTFEFAKRHVANGHYLFVCWLRWHCSQHVLRTRNYAHLWYGGK